MKGIGSIIVGGLMAGLLAGSAADAGDGQVTAGDIVVKYVEALGGRTALDTLSVRICEGRFIDNRPYRIDCSRKGGSNAWLFESVRH